MSDEDRAEVTAAASGERVPAPIGVAGAVAIVVLVVPLAALAARTPWNRLPDLLADGAIRDALRLSLVTSVAALAVSTLLGLPLAWLLARRDFPGRSLVRAVAVLPMVLPPVVGGVALVAAFGRDGLLGGPLAAATGWTLQFWPAGVVLAEAFVAVPFLIVTVEGGLRQVDSRLEAAAATLGAGRWTVLRRVTLPAVAPAISAGMALCWARALGEFGATITFAGNVPGRTQTMPLAVYPLLQSDPDAAYLLSFVLLGISLGVLLALRGRYLRS